MASPVCFDASTLINFHTDGSTILLAKQFRGRGLVAGHIADVELGASAIEILEAGGSRWLERVAISGAAALRRVSIVQVLLGSAQRHRGEAEAIVICEDYRAVLATDDDGAALVAQSRGIRSFSTVDILNALIATKHLAAKDAAGMAERMQSAGQNVDPSKIHSG